VPIAFETTSLPVAFLTMARASRIGTPDWSSVPSVRQNREMTGLLDDGPDQGALSLIRSMVRRPPLVLPQALTMKRKTKGAATMAHQYTLMIVRDAHQHERQAWGIGTLTCLNTSWNFGTMKVMIASTTATAIVMTHGGVDRRADDLPLQRLHALHEARETLEDDVEHAAGLAGLDHVDVELVEGLRMLGEGLGERGAGLDVLGDFDDDVLEEGRASAGCPRILRLRTIGRPASIRTDSWLVNWVNCLCLTRPARNRLFFALFPPVGMAETGGGAAARWVPGGGGVAVAAAVGAGSGAAPAFSFTFMGL
jgi:hypothetical protein